MRRRTTPEAVEKMLQQVQGGGRTMLSRYKAVQANKEASVKERETRLRKDGNRTGLARRVAEARQHRLEGEDRE